MLNGHEYATLDGISKSFGSIYCLFYALAHGPKAFFYSARESAE